MVLHVWKFPRIALRVTTQQMNKSAKFSLKDTLLPVCEICEFDCSKKKKKK